MATERGIKKENFPLSFTICGAFMFENLGYYITAPLFVLLDKNRKTKWLEVKFQSFNDRIEFDMSISGRGLSAKSSSLYFPMQWTRVCFSLNSNTSMATLVVDGNRLMEVNVVVNKRPSYLNIEFQQRSSVKITHFNMFANPMSNMEAMTRTGTDMCGTPGDFINWEGANWTVSLPQAKVVSVDSTTGPCRMESKIHVYPMLKAQDYHSDCMQHCEKLGGRSPSVKTFQEWQNFYVEIQQMQYISLQLPTEVWLSATEGDKNLKLSRLDHWPEDIEAVEGVWRDYYTGAILDNYTMAWSSPNKDNEKGDKYNCIYCRPASSVRKSLVEWTCRVTTIGCPCSYKTLPVLRLRGFCLQTNIEHTRYTPMHLDSDPRDIVMTGKKNAQIKYNSTQSKWTIEDSYTNVKAMTRARHNTFALGKHNWTISGDKYDCSKGQSNYTIEMKLTGCEEGEFTCDDGQCVNMTERCNQLPDCRDRSDETSCQILYLESGYNMRVPPISISALKKKSVKPVFVKISVLLYKVVDIDEEGHSIELQFQITLQWNENRATYHNLKDNMYLNALPLTEINNLWLPLVIYTNTDQQETTRLGVDWEWTTNVWVKREGNFERSGFEVLNEIEIFKGTENSLVMVQSYTHKFQCVYQLEKYPFDTQVNQCTYSQFYQFLSFFVRNV